MNPPAPRWFRHRRALAAVLVVVLVGAWAADVAYRVTSAGHQLLLARSSANAAHRVLGPAISLDPARWPDTRQFDAATEQLVTAQTALAAADHRLGYLKGLASRLAWLPRWGPAIASAPRLLALGERVTGDAVAVLRLVRPLLEHDGPAVEVARSVIVTNGAALEQHLDALASAGAEAAELRGVQWPAPFDAVAPIIGLLEEDSRRAADTADLVRVLRPSFDRLLGFDRPTRYVVLGQNDDEIRATGGFIGSLGTVTLRNGKIDALSFQGSRLFDRQDILDYETGVSRVRPQTLQARTPPAPMIRHLGASWWLVRDANYWPDFPTSARQVLRFLHEDRQIEADGVIAIGSVTVQSLLRVFGPLRLPEFSEPVTAENWFALAEGAILDAREGHENAKRSYLEPVMRELLTRAQVASGAQLPALLRALRTTIAGRDLQLYAEDASLQAIFTAFNADGGMVVSPGHDFLAVVDTNYSYSKIQPAITRKITYVRHADGVVDVVVEWRNTLPQFEASRYRRIARDGALFDLRTSKLVGAPGVLGNFARIYVPPGTQVLSVDGFDSAPGYSVEGETAVVSGFLVVRPGAARTLRLSYIPSGFGAGTPAGLVVWKQAGQQNDHLKVLFEVGGTERQSYDGALTQSLKLAWP